MNEREIAEMGDLSKHAVRQALDAVRRVATLAPLGVTPSLYLNVGIQMLISSASLLVTLRDDREHVAAHDHPDVLKIMHAYADALKIYPQPDAMLHAIVAAMKATGHGDRFNLEAAVVVRG